MIELKEISKKYKDVVALDNVSLNIDGGQIIGLFGENGAGKTTLMKSVFGYISHGGSILLDGEKITRKKMQKLSYATCEHSFFPGITASDHKEFFRDQFDNFKEKRYDVLMEFFGLPMDKKIKTFTVESGSYVFSFNTPLNGFIKVPVPKGYKVRYDVTKDDKDRIVEYGIWDYDKDGKTLNKDELVIKGFGAFDSENLYFTIDSKTMNPSDRSIYKVKPKADIDMYSQKITDFEAIDFKDVKKAVGISSDEKIGEIITDSDKDLIVVTYKGNKYIVKTYEKDTFKLKETSEFTMNGKYAMEMGIRQIGEKALALSTYNGLAILEKSNRGYTKKIEADAGKYFINFDKMTMIYNEGKLIIGETQNRENVRAGIYNKDKTLFVCEYAYDLGDDFGLVLDPYANETSYLGSTNNTGVDKKVVWPIKISSEEAK